MKREKANRTVTAKEPVVSGSGRRKADCKTNYLRTMLILFTMVGSTMSPSPRLNVIWAQLEANARIYRL